MSDLKFKLRDLVKLRDGIQTRELELKKSLIQLDEAKKNINRILSEHKNGNNDVIIYMPKITFENIKIHSESVKNNFNWKKVSLETLKASAEDLTTQMLYEKAKIKYPLELSDKIKSIHGFSAALSYLKNEKKVIQIKNSNKYFYGLPKKSS